MLFKSLLLKKLIDRILSILLLPDSGALKDPNNMCVISSGYCSFSSKGRQCLCKFLRANKVVYGRCANGGFSHEKAWIKLTVIINT